MPGTTVSVCTSSATYLVIGHSIAVPLTSPSPCADSRTGWLGADGGQPGVEVELPARQRRGAGGVEVSEAQGAEPGQQLVDVEQLGQVILGVIKPAEHSHKPDKDATISPQSRDLLIPPDRASATADFRPHWTR
jgi:hypothetical protein